MDHVLFVQWANVSLSEVELCTWEGVRQKDLKLGSHARRDMSCTTQVLQTIGQPVLLNYGWPSKDVD